MNVTIPAGLQNAAHAVLPVLRRLPVALIRRGLTFLLVVIIVYQLAQIVWTLVPEQPELPVGTATNIDAGSAAAAASKPLDIRALTNKNWFGEAQAKPALEEAKIVPQLDVAEENAVETRLDLVLFGVVLSAEQEDSRAMIAHRKEQKSYAVGEKMPAGNRASLAKILSDRVIIDNGGRFEYLALYDKDNQARIAETAPKPRPRPTRKLQEKELDYRNDQEVTELLSGYRERLMSNPASLAEVIRISTYNKNGKMHGYRILPGRDRKTFSKLGLKSNDVITEINGIKLDNPGSALQLLGVIREATEANLVIERGSEQVSLLVALDNV